MSTSAENYFGYYFLKDCEIEYSGRAKATGFNDSLLTIIKFDNTVICHDISSGLKAKYYNTSKSLSVNMQNESIEIVSINKKGESLIIKGKIETKNIVSSIKPKKKDFEFKIGTESDMVEWIKNNLEKFHLKKEDFIGVEQRISSGRIDLLLKDCIIEVKKKAGARTFDQIYRYIREKKTSKAFIVCLHASDTLISAVEKVKTVKIIEISDIEERTDEIAKENY